MIEFQSNRRRAAEVELTPLIDVVFQLLVFFLLTSAFIHPGIVVELPDASSGDAAEDATVSISIDDAGRIFLDEEPVSLGRLETILASRAAVSTDTRVAIWGDIDVRYGLFMEILDLCRVSGLTNVQLMVDRIPEGAGPR